MSQATDSRLTAESLYALPDDDRHYELVRGHLVEEPRPTPMHGRIAATIAHLLMSYLDTNPVGVVLTCDPGFILARAPDTVRGPDVALLLHERYPKSEGEKKFISGAPDLAVEVLLPSNRPGALADKVSDYLGAGAACVWIVDPEGETLQVHRHGRAPVKLGSTQRADLPDLLPGFSVIVADIFQI